MSINLPQKDIIRYVNAFKELLNTFPIIPIGLVKQISQDASFAEYILRIGAILKRESMNPIIDVHSYVPQPDSEQTFLCGYFNLVQAVYFQFRGIADKAKECCEKTFMVIQKGLEQSPDDPNLNMMIWSYWLIYR